MKISLCLILILACLSVRAVASELPIWAIEKGEEELVPAALIDETSSPVKIARRGTCVASILAGLSPGLFFWATGPERIWLHLTLLSAPVGTVFGIYVNSLGSDYRLCVSEKKLQIPEELVHSIWEFEAQNQIRSQWLYQQPDGRYRTGQLSGIVFNLNEDLETFQVSLQPISKEEQNERVLIDYQSLKDIRSNPPSTETLLEQFERWVLSPPVQISGRSAVGNVLSGAEIVYRVRPDRLTQLAALAPDPHLAYVVEKSELEKTLRYDNPFAIYQVRARRLQESDRFLEAAVNDANKHLPTSSKQALRSETLERVVVLEARIPGTSVAERASIFHSIVWDGE